MLLVLNHFAILVEHPLKPVDFALGKSPVRGHPFYVRGSDLLIDFLKKAERQAGLRKGSA